MLLYQLFETSSTGNPPDPPLFSDACYLYKHTDNDKRPLGVHESSGNSLRLTGLPSHNQVFHA